jgi:predicted dehydrogenase
MLKVGVVGIGFGQHAHVPAFRRQPGCAVHAICASTLDRARAVAGRLEIPRAYGDWRMRVKDPDIDVISVATPPALQPEIVMAALERRKPVFCEKPLAVSVRAASGMLAAAEAAGVAHMVNFEFPAMPAWVCAHNMIRSGAIGSLTHVSVTWHVHSHAVREQLASWKVGDADAGGGVLNAFGSHVFQYVESLFGKVVSLSARLFGQPPAGGAEQSALLWLELEGGALVTVSLCNAAGVTTGHRVEIHGQSGAIVLDNPGHVPIGAFTVARAEGKTGTFTTQALPPEPGSGDGRIAATALLVDRFVEWIVTGVAQRPTLLDGFRVQCLLEAARLSDSTGSWIETTVEAFTPCR